MSSSVMLLILGVNNTTTQFNKRPNDTELKTTDWIEDENATMVIVCMHDNDN